MTKSSLIIFSVFVLGYIGYAVSFNVFKTGGVHLGESDEFTHLKIVSGLDNRFLPFYSGRPFFYDPPLYFWVSFILRWWFKDPLVSLRLVSFLSTLLTSFLIYFYVRRLNFTPLSALFGSLAFLLNPFTVFYSQIGVIEPFLSLLIFGFFLLFDLYLRGGRIYLSAFSAFLFAAAFLTKFTPLFFLPLVFLIFLYKSVKFNLKTRDFLRKGYFLIDLGSFLPLAGIFLTLVFVVFLGFREFPEEFKFQTYQVLGLTKDAVFMPLANFFNPDILSRLPWWFSPTFLIASLSGICNVLWRLRREKGNLFLLLTFVLVVFSVSSRLPFHPRYAVILLPFLALFAAFFAEAVTSLRIGKLLSLVILIFYILSQVEGVVQAYLSSKQSLLKQAVAFVDTIDRTGKAWIFSNYWPNIVADVAKREKYGWLTKDNAEIAVFNPQEKRAGDEILTSEMSFALVEDLYSQINLVASGPRDQALRYLKSAYFPVATFYEESGNFPFSKKVGNRIDVYYFAD